MSFFFFLKKNIVLRMRKNVLELRVWWVPSRLLSASVSRMWADLLTGRLSGNSPDSRVTAAMPRLRSWSLSSLVPVCVVWS